MSKGSCELCGKKFTNVFDAVNHARQPGSEESFNPEVILDKDQRRLGLGLLLHKVYQHTDNEYVEEAVEEAFSLLYIAKMRPKAFPVIYDHFVKSLKNDTYFNVMAFVYEIVSQEAFKEVGLRP